MIKLTETIHKLVCEVVDDLYFEAVLREIDDITKAKEFARDIHSGQWRRGKPVPYMAHPMRVFHRAKKSRLSKTHQVLALLHDTYEDAQNPTKVLLKIKEMFGSKVANLVQYLSHDKSVNYSDYLEKLARSSKIAFDIKMLDILDNLSDAPKPKQIQKYKNALLHLVKSGVDINPKMKDVLFRLSGVNQ